MHGRFQFASFCRRGLRRATRGVLAAGFLLCLLGSVGWSQARPAGQSATKPILTAELPSINRGYEDIRFLFDLSKDQKGYETFKETLDAFIEGVEIDKPVGLRTYLAGGALHTVASLPVRSEADFQKFLKNLWDLDVKSAPPPNAKLLPQVPRDVLAKTRSMKLEKDERILFGLSDGFVRFEQGFVHLGRTIEDVRVAHGGVHPDVPHGDSLAMHLDGRGVAPSERRAAFEKSKQDFIAKTKRENFKTDADYELARTVLDYQLSKFELLFSESSLVNVTWTTSREKKQWQLDGTVTPEKETALAKDLESIGKSADEFAGVAKQGTAVWVNINVPVDRNLGKKLASVAGQARGVSRDKIDKASGLTDEQKANDKQFADFIATIADDVSGTSHFNGFLRSWPAGERTLTTIGAAQVSDGQKYRELVRKFQNQEQAGKEGDVEIHKVVLAQWPKDYPELFDKNGAVYLGIADKTVWYAVGPKAIDRLKQAIQEAKSGGEKSETAIELHAELQPLTEVWNLIRSRQPEGAAKKVEKKSDEQGKRRISEAASTISDLKLHKVAADSFKGGEDDTVTFSLKRKGDKAELSARFDEGVLRFAGNALSKFVKENLED